VDTIALSTDSGSVSLLFRLSVMMHVFYSLNYIHIMNMVLINIYNEYDDLDLIDNIGLEADVD